MFDGEVIKDLNFCDLGGLMVVFGRLLMLMSFLVIFFGCFVVKWDLRVDLVLNKVR